MKRVLVLCVVAACGKGGEICEPFSGAKLPGITKIDECTDHSFFGETTATVEQWQSAFAAAGWEVGRDRAATDTGNWFYIRKGEVSYRIGASFGMSKTRKNPAFYITSGSSLVKLVPESEWRKLASLEADAKTLGDSYAWLDAAVANTSDAPATCGALIDPSIADAPHSLVQLRDGAVTTNQLFAKGVRVNETTESMIARRKELDSMLARRMLPVIRVTSYTAPRIPRGTGPNGTFEPGGAKFEVAVVDAKDKKVLCKSRASAGSSGTLEATIIRGAASADVDADLQNNMREAAFRELATMTTAYAPMK